jgi:hypothetical protein
MEAGGLPREKIANMTGLEVLRAMAAGQLPGPGMGKIMGFRLVEVDLGLAVFEGTPGPHLLNPLGSVHGGYALTLIDSACGCAVHSERWTSLAPPRHRCAPACDALVLEPTVHTTSACANCGGPSNSRSHDLKQREPLTVETPNLHVRTTATPCLQLEQLKDTFRWSGLVPPIEWCVYQLPRQGRTAAVPIVLKRRGFKYLNKMS